MVICLKNKHTLKIDDFYFKCCFGENGKSKKKREGGRSSWRSCLRQSARTNQQTNYTKRRWILSGGGIKMSKKGDSRSAAGCRAASLPGSDT